MVSNVIICALIFCCMNYGDAAATISVVCQRFPESSVCKPPGPSNNGQAPVNPGPQSVTGTVSGNGPMNPTSIGHPPPQGNVNGIVPQNGGPPPESAIGAVNGNGPVNPTAIGLPPPPQGNQNSGGPSQAQVGPGAGPVNPSSVGLPPPPPEGNQGAVGGPQPQPQGIGSQWNQRTREAQAEQARQALIDAERGSANCGQYEANYNVWCGGPQQIDPTYCSTLARICADQAQKAASGQGTVGGPFAGNNGLPTGGAGSIRPLTIGNSLGVGPFATVGKTLAVNPLTGVGQTKGVDIPILGLGVHQTKGAEWGGLPGVAQLGAALGRRRRWAIPLGVNQFGHAIYLNL